MEERSDPSPAQKLGIQVHKILEDYLRDGEPPDLSDKAGRVALSGLRYLPAPGPENKPEHWFQFAVDGIEYSGTIDCWRPGDKLLIDHKTSVDIEQYSLRGKAFEEDIQRVLYGNAVGHDVVFSRWVYYQTRPPFVARVEEREDTREHLVGLREQLIDPFARKMQQLKDEPVEGFPRNAGACDVPFRCKYKKRCWS